MNKIKKELKKTKTKSKDSPYHSKEFKQLQMKWYKKLDKSGFNDIERTGKNRQKYFNEYSGILAKPLSILKRNINSFDFTHYSISRKFSWYDGDLRTLEASAASPDSPTHCNCSNNALSEAKKGETVKEKAHNCTNCTCNAQIAQADPVFLSSSDRTILRMYGDGCTIEKISNHLRSYHARFFTRTKRGPQGKPYSVFYVHRRIKQLMKLAIVWDKMGQPE